MYDIKNSDNQSKNYKYMLFAIKDLLETESDEIALLSNISAFINEYTDNINWVGFYLNKDNELVLGPFQGKPACIRIKYGKGVCGTAFSTKETQLVKNVEEFPGHIACDSASKSEIVVPIIINDEVYGVLDIDSPILNRFDNEEKEVFEEVINMLIKNLK